MWEYATSIALSAFETCKKLKAHVESCPSIPHEIGLFLGYPPEDVKGFIEKNAMEYKCKGYFKVYSDEERAKCLFSEYSKCRARNLEKYRNGAKLIDLIAIA